MEGFNRSRKAKALFYDSHTSTISQSFTCSDSSGNLELIFCTLPGTKAPKNEVTVVEVEQFQANARAWVQKFLCTRQKKCHTVCARTS